MTSLSLSHLCLVGISALGLTLAPGESAGLVHINVFVPMSAQRVGTLPAMHPPRTTPNANDWVAIGSDVDEHGPVLWQLDSRSWRSNSGQGDALLLATYAYSQTIENSFTFASVVSHHKFNCLEEQLSLSERIFYSGRYGTGTVVGLEYPGPNGAIAQPTIGAREDAMLQALCRERPTTHLLL